MPDIPPIAGFGAFCLIVGVGAYFILARGEAVAFNDGREKRLTERLAKRLGCPLAVAVDPVRRELGLAPDQTDDTILKRAEYHYRRNLPEPGLCRGYRDQRPG